MDRHWRGNRGWRGRCDGQNGEEAGAAGEARCDRAAHRGHRDGRPCPQSHATGTRSLGYAAAVPVLALKLVLTPLLIAGASLAARRWGPAIGGLLIALPLTSGPVAFFLAVDHGAAFAAGAVVGSLGGLVAITGFCLAYAAVGPRAGAAAGIGAASAAFAGVGSPCGR